MPLPPRRLHDGVGDLRRLERKAPPLPDVVRPGLVGRHVLRRVHVPDGKQQHQKRNEGRASTWGVGIYLTT